MGRLRRTARFARDEKALLSLRVRVRRDLSPPPARAYRSFGSDSVVVPPARVNSPECIVIGDDVRILEGAWLAVFAQPGLPAPRLEIGARTHVGRSCHIACVGAVTIGEDVLTADHVFIADTYHGFEQASVPIIDQPMSSPRPVSIGSGSFLGIRSVILPGTTLGVNAYVGAGAVVDRNVPARTVVVGNPAHPVRTWDDAAGSWRAVAGWDDLVT